MTHPSQDWLDRSNAETLYHLERQGRTGPGLVPFLGAGLSSAFGLKDWKNLLLDAASPRLRPLVERRLQKNDYEGAAEILLKDLDADAFQNMVAASAGDAQLRTADFRKGTVSLLPLLAGGPVVTTNFDRALERAFAANGSPFESVISGPRPDLIVDALHGDRRVLIKLHGDWQDRIGRTFAASDYDTNYGKSQPERKRELLEGTERLIFSSRSLLFIGASLGPDRTVSVLQAVHKEYAGIRHFAIMKAPTGKKAFYDKEAHLRTCGVLPLWYHAETAKDHVEQVEALVATIVERISVQTVPTTAEEPLPPRSWRRSRRSPQRPAPPALKVHFDRVTRLVDDGRITFVLGSAIHDPTKLMAQEFYEELARVFECEALKEERFAVAQYIADRYGRENLYAEIRKLFARNPLKPRDTHQMFAAWRSYRKPNGDPVPFPTIVTTNYDDMLEMSLTEAGLPYHLLSYQSDGSQRGRFYHRAPDNSVRIIERPRNIRRLSGGFVIVKLNGGFNRHPGIRESYSTTRLDYWDLAGRIPDVLPAAVQQTLSENPMLFLGHGLRAADVESLIRFAHKEHPGPRSWAVLLFRNQDRTVWQPTTTPEGAEYWQQLGIRIVNQPVNLYVNEIRSRLERRR